MQPVTAATAARRRAALMRYALVAPAIVIIVGFMVLPLGLMLTYSFLEPGRYGGVVWSYSPEAYIRFFFERDLDDSLVFNLAYVRIFFRSFALAFVTTLVALLIGFPAALYIAMQSPRWRNFLIFLVTVPFWTNLLVRNYAWILILREQGLINEGLLAVGVIEAPIRMIYNNFGITVGLVYSFIPFMVLPIYASLERIDFRLVEAAYDLGANRWQALRRIILPLARPGIYAGCILVFIPCLGAYVTPALLGGGRNLMIGNLIQLQFGASQNWPFGAALAFVLMAIVLLSMLFYLWRFRGRGTGGLGVG